MGTQKQARLSSSMSLELSDSSANAPPDWSLTRLHPHALWCLTLLSCATVFVHLPTFAHRPSPDLTAGGLHAG